MRSLGIAVLIMTAGLLSALPMQTYANLAKPTDGKPSTENKPVREVWKIAAPLLGFDGAAVGLIYWELLSVHLGSKREENIIFRPEGANLEPKTVCQRLSQSYVQQAMASTATLALLLLVWAKAEALEQSGYFPMWTIIGSYGGGLIGARLATSLLCQKEPPQWWQKANRIILSVLIATGLGAALGFNLIW